MPSGSKKRKAAKKKKEEEIVLTKSHQDSANEHDRDHGNENDDDDIRPKTPVQAQEGDGNSSDAESGSPIYDGSKQEEQTQENSFLDIQGQQYHPVGSTDISLGVSDNMSASSSDVLVHDSNGPIESSVPFTDAVDPHPEEDRDINMESPAQSSEKYGGDKTQGSELDARTDITLGVSDNRFGSSCDAAEPHSEEDRDINMENPLQSSEKHGGDETQRSELDARADIRFGVSDNRFESSSDVFVHDNNVPIESSAPFTDAEEPHPEEDRDINLESPVQSSENYGGDETQGSDLDARIDISLGVSDNRFESLSDVFVHDNNVPIKSSAPFTDAAEPHPKEDRDINMESPAQSSEKYGGEETQGSELDARTDTSLGVSDNRFESSSDVFVHGNNAPIESSAPFTDAVELDPPPEENRDINMESSAQSAEKYGRDETQGSELDARTDVSSVFITSEIVGGDENKLQVLSSEEVEDKHDQIQSAGPFTDLCGHFLAESSDITVGSQSQASEVSDDDESKLEVVSSTAVADPNESVQSLGSVDSPRSFQSMNSHRFSEHNSYDRVILTYQEQECDSEGVLETPWKELSSEANIPVSLVHVDDFESPQDQDVQANSFSKESSLDFRNDEQIQDANEIHNISHVTLEEGLAKLVSNSEQTLGASLISSVASVTESELTCTVDEDTLFESNVIVVPSMKTEITEPIISTGGEISRDDLGSSQVEDNPSDTKENATEEAALHLQNAGKKVCIVFDSPQDQDGQANSLIKESSLDFGNEECIQVTNEVHTVSTATLEGLTELVSNSEQAQGASLISSVDAVTESESTRTVEENTLLESNVMAVPLIKTGSSKAITEPMISAGRVISRDDLGSSRVEDNPSDAKENTTEEAALHPQNVGNKVCIVSGSPQDQDGQANSLFKESSLDLRSEEQIQVTNEVHTVSHDTLEGLTELVSNFEQTQGASLSISVAAVTERESTRTVEENTLLESNGIAVPLIKTESSKAIIEPRISTSREISRDDLGSSHAEENPNDTKENATEVAALHPQNVGKKDAVSLKREPRTSWMSCCGILEIFTGSRS